METRLHRGVDEVVGCCRKNVKKTIHKYKKEARCYWPELHLYCGVCDLKTGLYIRSGVSVIVYLVVVTINVLMLYFIMSTGKMLYAMDMEDLEEYFGLNFNDGEVLARVQNLYTLVVTYLILWIIFKIFYIIALFSTIYAIYKRKPKILKVVLFINTLNWILDILISIFGAVLLRVVSKLLLVICLLSEGYNIFAIASEYKQLRGKSKLLMNMNQANRQSVVAINQPIDQIYSTTNHEVPRYQNPKHCETCSCNHYTSPPVTTDRITPTSVDNINQNVDEEKPMNLKDIEIIFNQEQLMPQYSSLLETNCVIEDSMDVQRVPGSRALEELSYNLDKKADISNVSIIYDENQLQVGGSPVIESRGTSWIP